MATGGATKVRRVANRLHGWVIAPWSGAQGEGQKTFCCVTTRGRNLKLRGCLWQRGGALTARMLGLGVLGFGRLVLASSGLPSGSLPAAQLAAAFRVLAVALVPAPWQVLSATAFAQADSRPRSSWPSPAARLGLTMRAAHGSVDLPRDSPGGTCSRSPRALITTSNQTIVRQSNCTLVKEPDREGNGLRKIGTRRQVRTRGQSHLVASAGSLQTLTTGSLLPIGPTVPSLTLIG